MQAAKRNMATITHLKEVNKMSKTIKIYGPIKPPKPLSKKEIEAAQKKKSTAKKK